METLVSDYSDTSISIISQFTFPDQKSRTDVSEYWPQKGAYSLGDLSQGINLSDSTANSSWITPGYNDLLNSVPEEKLKVYRHLAPVFVTQVVGKANRRLLELASKHFTSNGRAQRVKIALEALNLAIVDYGVDSKTIRRIAEDEDLEDM